LDFGDCLGNRIALAAAALASKAFAQRQRDGRRQALAGKPGELRREP